MKTQAQGQLGESLARSFLEHAGYRFLESNFTRRVGEIDLVMLAPVDPPDTDTVVVFVEVRYRATPGFGGALASIDWKKQRKMTRVANAWLQRNASSTQLARIDVITLEPLVSGELRTPSNSSHNLTTDVQHWKNHRINWIPNAVEDST